MTSMIEMSMIEMTNPAWAVHVYGVTVTIKVWLENVGLMSTNCRETILERQCEQALTA